MTIATEIERILRETIKVDASGLAPAVVAHHITGFEEAARRIAYESAKQKEAEGWRDIASAPEDGTEILVWGREAQVPHDRLRRIVVRYSRGWWSTTHPSMAVKAFHWRPLPEPPSALLSAGGEG